MSKEPVFKYAKLLNTLSDMQGTPYYATRKGELREAELAIVALEQENKILLAKIKAHEEKATLMEYIARERESCARVCCSKSALSVMLGC